MARELRLDPFAEATPNPKPCICTYGPRFADQTIVVCTCGHGWTLLPGRPAEMASGFVR